MRLTLIISSLQAGGAERQMSIMANYWAAGEWEITLLTFDDGRSKPFYSLDQKVKHIPMNIAAVSSNLFAAVMNNLRRLRALRRAIQDSRPDAVLSFMDKVNVLSLLSAIGTGRRVIVGERIDPVVYVLGFVWEKLRKFSYLTADAIVVQTESAKRYFSSRIQHKTFVIPNGVIPPLKSQGKAWVEISRPAVVAVGRLDKQKGFDLLLEAFGKAGQSRRGWHLYVFGEGSERVNLEKQKKTLGLNEIIHLPGVAKNISHVYQNADLFVLSSRFEGFPNVLCEAMACGLSVIGFDCPSGPRDIIRDGVDGVLIPNGDVTALAKAMDRLMSNTAERKRLASRATEVIERFGLEKIMGRWEELLRGAVPSTH